MTFVDPTNNFAFHKIFGNPKRPEVLPGFLNAVLQPKVPIVEVTVRNPYQESRLMDLKDTVVDVRATDAEGKEYIVEMQVERQHAWHERALYYTSKALVTQLDRGEDYEDLKPVYFVGILDFRLDPKQRSAEWFTRYRLREEQTREGYPLDFQLNFIELPRFKLALESVATDLEAWAWFFRHADKLTEAPDSLSQRPGLKAAFAEANALGWSVNELDDYEKVAHALIERRKREEHAYDKGKAEGIAKGIAEGRAEGIRETLRRLAQSQLDQGVPEAQVAALLQLGSLEDLYRLLADTAG